MIVKYNEYFDYNNSRISEIEREEIASVGFSATGIDGVILWFGPNPHDRRVKIRVSNLPDDLSGNNIFSIVIPNYSIDGDINSDFITKDKLEMINQYIKKNEDIIYKYSDGLICGSDFIYGLI